MNLPDLIKKLPAVQNEIHQFFLHNTVDLDKEIIKSIKETVKNIMIHAATARTKSELAKDMKLLLNLLQKYHFDEGLVSPVFSDLKFELELDYHEVISTYEPIYIKQEIDSERQQRKVVATEQKLINQSSEPPSALNQLLHKYRGAKKK